MILYSPEQVLTRQYSQQPKEEPSSKPTSSMDSSMVQSKHKHWMNICENLFSYADAHKNVNYTRKNAQAVIGLQTSCYKSVHKFSASCVRTACSMLLQQVWNKLWTICNKIDGIIRLVERLFQQVWCSFDITRMLQGRPHNVVYKNCYITTVPDLLEQPCNKSDNINNVVTNY